MADGTLTTAEIDAPAACDVGARTHAVVDRQLEALGEVLDIGLKIARAIERQVNGAEAPSMADLNAAAMAYARVARAIRQTVMLQSKLTDERRTAAAKAGDLRARVARIARGVIEDGHEAPEQIERLVAEAAEGLEQERYGDILTRPVGEIVAALCKDLGFDPDWSDLADEIAAAEAFARGEGSAASSQAGPIEVRWLDDDDDDELPSDDSS